MLLDKITLTNDKAVRGKLLFFHIQINFFIFYFYSFEIVEYLNTISHFSVNSNQIKNYFVAI